MKKRILCLAIAAIMVVGTQMTVLARDYQGADNWQVEFDGKDMISNFQTEDLTDAIAEVQPGDSIDLKVKISNKSGEETDWYLSNEIIKNLEESSKTADGGAYEYRLSYTDKDGTTVLCDSTAVDDAESGTGLQELSKELGEYFYLDRLAKGGEGDVHMYLKVDGETQGNAYQNALTQLQMKFAVEKVGTTTKNIVKKNTKTVTKTVGNTIKTGDTAKPLLLCTLTLVSGIVLLFLGIKAMKDGSNKRNRKRGGR